MGRFLEQPVKVYRVMVPLLVVAWFAAGVGGDDTPSSGGLGYRVGATFWAIFLLTLLFIILFTLALAVHRVLRRSA